MPLFNCATRMSLMSRGGGGGGGGANIGPAGNRRGGRARALLYFWRACVTVNATLRAALSASYYRIRRLRRIRRVVELLKELLISSSCKLKYLRN